MDALKLRWTSFSTIARNNSDAELLTRGQTLSTSARPSKSARSSKNKFANFRLDCKPHFNSTDWTTDRLRNQCGRSAFETARSNQESLGRVGKSQMACAKRFTLRQMGIRLGRVAHPCKSPKRTPWNFQTPHCRLPAASKPQAKMRVSTRVARATTPREEEP